MPWNAKIFFASAWSCSHQKSYRTPIRSFGMGPPPIRAPFLRGRPSPVEELSAGQIVHREAGAIGGQLDRVLRLTPDLREQIELATGPRHPLHQCLHDRPLHPRPVSDLVRQQRAELLDQLPRGSDTLAPPALRQE